MIRSITLLLTLTTSVFAQPHPFADHFEILNEDETLAICDRQHPKHTEMVNRFHCKLVCIDGYLSTESKVIAPDDRISPALNNSAILGFTPSSKRDPLLEDGRVRPLKSGKGSSLQGVIIVEATESLADKVAYQEDMYGRNSGFYYHQKVYGTFYAPSTNNVLPRLIGVTPDIVVARNLVKSSQNAVFNAMTHDEKNHALIRRENEIKSGMESSRTYKQNFLANHGDAIKAEIEEAKRKELLYVPSNLVTKKPLVIDLNEYPYISGGPVHVRGHYRHLKNGTTVYVHPHTRSRPRR